MPTMDSYRSFSDIGLPPGLSAQFKPRSDADGSISQSSSAYSLDALSLPDENAGSSSSSSRDGDVYSDAAEGLVQGSVENPQQGEFKVPLVRSSRNIAANAATPNPRSASQSGRESRESSSGSHARSREKNLPSYMRGTAASSSRRSSVSSFNETLSGADNAQLFARRVRPSEIQENVRRAQQASQPRSANPSSAVIPASAALSGTELGHIRQASTSSIRSKRSLPAPINTSGMRYPSDGSGFPSASDYNVRRPHSSKTPFSHSPSAIAHSILRSIRSSDAPPDADVSQVAESDKATSEAMRRLDGISSTGSAASPRMSRAYSGASARSVNASPADATPRKATGSSTLSRENSKASTRTSSPHTTASRPSSVRKSWAKGATLPVPPVSQLDSLQTSAVPMSSGRSIDEIKAGALPGSFSAPALHTVSGGSVHQSPRIPSGNSSVAQSHAAVSIGNRGSGANSLYRPPSIGSAGDAIPIPSVSSKRSSSASLAFGGGPPSTIASQDSTSATSVSAHYGSPVAPHHIVGRSASKANRRTSGSSDVSSIHSPLNVERAGDLAAGAEGYEVASEQYIPPVPPLPKDWESYRPSTAGEASAPNPAKDASFSQLAARETDMLSPASAYGDVSLSNSRTSLDRPAGPRPLRVVSGPAAMQPLRMVDSSKPVSPSLPSPILSEGHGLPSSAEAFSRTPTKKWSLSSAFHMHRNPTLPVSSSRTSINNIIEGTDSRQPHSTVSQMPSRKLASVPDIRTLSTTTSPGLQASQSSRSLYKTAANRPRTDSISSGGTAHALAGPSVVATSPGRSRSSLLSPRRTPSGIPFFNRKSSSTLHNAQDPGSPKSTHSSTHRATNVSEAGEDRPGRRSILGINLFHRSSASRKSISSLQGQGIPLWPKLPKEYQDSANPVTSPSRAEAVSEFGVRPSNESRRSSMTTKASSLIGRKRGKVCRWIRRREQS